MAVSIFLILYVLSVVIAYTLGKKDYARLGLKMGPAAIIMVLLPVVNIGAITGALWGILDDQK